MKKCGNEAEKCGTSVVKGMVGTHGWILKNEYKNHATMTDQPHWHNTDTLTCTSIVKQLYSTFTTIIKSMKNV